MEKMKKIDFLAALEKRLLGLPDEDRERSLEYYGEMIVDRMEDGMDEESAVADVGTPETAAEAILADVPLSRLVKERIKPKRKLAVWEIILLVLGSPVWLSLLIAALAVLLAAYASLWAGAVCLWSAVAAFGGGALCGVLVTPICFASGNPADAVFLLGAGLLAAGLGIFAFHGCLAVTKGLCRLTKKMFLLIKCRLVRKETVK